MAIPATQLAEITHMNATKTAFSMTLDQMRAAAPNASPELRSAMLAEIVRRGEKHAAKGRNPESYRAAWAFVNGSGVSAPKPVKRTKAPKVADDRLTKIEQSIAALAQAVAALSAAH
jgi:hypothetical protein